MTWEEVQRLPAGEYLIYLGKGVYTPAFITPHELSDAYKMLVAHGKDQQVFATQADVVRAADQLDPRGCV